MGKLKSNRVVDPHATQLVSGFRAPEFTAVRKIWPIVSVNKETGKFMQFAADASVLRTNMKRALGDDRKRIEMRVGSGSFATAEFSIEVPLYDRELRNVVEGMEGTYRDKKALIGMSSHQLLMEYTIAQLIQDPTKYDVNNTVALAGGDQWKETTSTPFADMRGWVRFMSHRLLCPTSELSIAIGSKPWESLQDHADTQEKVKYTGKEASYAWLASVLDIKEVVPLPGMYVDSVDDANPDDVTGIDIFGDVLIVYREIAQPTAADPLWGAIARLGEPTVTEYRDEPRSADIIAVDDEWGVCQNSNKRGFLVRTVSGLA